MWSFFSFIMISTSSFSTADLLTVVANGIARAFIMSGATQVVALLDTLKALEKVWHAGLPQNF